MEKEEEQEVKARKRSQQLQATSSPNEGGHDQCEKVIIDED